MLIHIAPKHGLPWAKQFAEFEPGLGLCDQPIWLIKYVFLGGHSFWDPDFPLIWQKFINLFWMNWIPFYLLIYLHLCPDCFFDKILTFFPATFLISNSMFSCDFYCILQPCNTCKLLIINMPKIRNSCSYQLYRV